MPVTCVALRSADQGAELTRLLAPHGVAVHVVEQPEEAQGVIAALRDEHVVLVDTPGVPPTAEATLRELGADLRAIGADEIHLAVPATIDAYAGRELVEASAELGPKAIALTHADGTRRLGTVIELAVASGLPLSYVGRGSSLEAGLRPANAEDLALALVP